MPSANFFRLSSRPMVAALLAQTLGCLMALVFAFIIPELRSYPFVLTAIQGSGATIASYHLDAPRWWQVIHLLFGPAIFLGLQAPVPPWAWLAGFISLFLVFGRTDQSRVPLFLTNSTVGEVLLTLIPPQPSFIGDLGCGDGRLLRQLARSRPDCEFIGIEHALLTYLWARLRSSALPNIHIRLGSLWKQPLAPYDLIYVFLSPTPMVELWQKASTEMRPGTLLVSNSFAVPNVESNSVIAVSDRRNSQLHCYRIAEIMED